MIAPLPSPDPAAAAQAEADRRQRAVEATDSTDPLYAERQELWARAQDRAWAIQRKNRMRHDAR